MAKSDQILVLGAGPFLILIPPEYDPKITQNHLSFKPQCTQEISPIVIFFALCNRLFGKMEEEVNGFVQCALMPAEI